jgi:hypothetical protein
MQERITLAARSTNRRLKHFLLHCHVMDIPARISFDTTAMIVVLLLSSYEEMSNLSRCIAHRFERPAMGNEMLSSPQVHEFSR